MICLPIIPKLEESQFLSRKFKNKRHIDRPWGLNLSLGLRQSSCKAPWTLPVMVESTVNHQRGNVGAGELQQHTPWSNMFPLSWFSHRAVYRCTVTYTVTYTVIYTTSNSRNPGQSLCMFDSGVFRPGKRSLDELQPGNDWLMATSCGNEHKNNSLYPTTH